MGWEDDLRELDGEVAAGRISAPEHRRRREELLAARGRGVEHSENPFPPAFSWSGGPTGATQVLGPLPPPADVPAADATQVVRPPDGADATQVVPRGGRGPATPPADDVDRTQVVRLAPGPGRPPGPPRETTPPWHVAPPTRGAGGPWGSAGPDFAAPRTSPWTRGRVAGLVAAGLVVVVALVLGAVALLGDDGPAVAAGPSSTRAAIAPTTTPTTTPQGPAALSDALVPLPGQGQKDDEYTVAQLAGAERVAPATVTALAAAGTTSTLVRTSTDGGLSLRVAGFTTDGVAGAATVLAAVLAAQQQRSGNPADGALGPDGTSTVASTDPTAPRLRGTYASDDRLVQVEVAGADPQAVQQRFTELLAQQLVLLPPTRP